MSSVSPPDSTDPSAVPGERRRAPDPRRADLKALARSGETLSGDLPLSAMPRLRAAVAEKLDTIPDDGMPPVEGAQATWSASASSARKVGGHPAWWLDLKAHIDAPLQCQRCLEPLAWPLEVDRTIGFVEGDDLAERLDEDSEDDILPLPPRLDIPSLVEDELILALPLIAMHESCPAPLPTASQADAANGAASAAAEESEERPNPFAALAALKTRRSD